MVYIGIRMALSTVAEKKAVYKNWLMNWFASFILLFMLHFIIRGTIYLNGQLVKIFEKSEVSEMSDSILGFVTVTGTLAEKTMLGVATVGFAALGVYMLGNTNDNVSNNVYKAYANYFLFNNNSSINNYNLFNR